MCNIEALSQNSDEQADFSDLCHWCSNIRYLKELFLNLSLI